MTWKEVFKLPFNLSVSGLYVYDDNGRIVMNITDNKDYALMILNVLNGGEEHFRNSPFVDNVLSIIDSKGEPVIIIRGWGYLTGIGGLNLSDSEALNIQDDLQSWILDKLNGK